ncbi:MAG: chitobiase/beta-hexosaminidase C-terminal domain-containing protein [Dorea sp.]
MKCRYCKAEIPEGELYCKKCGREVQIVPDYNPLEEMLTAQIQLDGNEQESEFDQYINQKRRNNNRTGQSAGRNTGSTGRGAGRNTGRSASRTTAAMTGRRMTGNTTGQMLTEKERRKRQSAKAARKKALRRKRRIVLLIMAAIVVLAGAGFYVVYQNSYNGIMKKAQKAAQSKDYTTAEAYYKQAISKNTKKADAYTGLADVYLLQDKADEGTTLFEEAVSKQSGNVELYKACMDFYLKSDQNMKIPELLDSVSDSMLEKLSDYVVDEPKFSLEDSTTYDDVQKLLLTADKDTIYYTTDGTDPDLTSTKYTSEGIQIERG